MNTSFNRKKSLFFLSIGALLLLFSTAYRNNFNLDLRTKTPDDIKGEEIAVLTSPPFVPAPIKRDYATKMIVHLEVIEKEGTMVDGVTYTYWTFGGSVPGKFIRVREGDFVEFHLKNHPSSKLPHNIDLHAVNGPGGGATSSFTAPGHESIFSFTAKNPGLFIYHCATAPVGMHIGNGMYGLILVEPKEGLPPVDKEYYVCQGDFYTKGSYGESGLQPFSMAKALDEKPDYVVFNGSVGALTGDNSLKAKVGEKVRLFIGNGGPNLVSSFHVIGEIFDKVYLEGSLKAISEHVQTTLIPAGGAAITEFLVDVPGNFILVDHSIFRAFNKGALAILKVDGETDKMVYSGKQDDRIYQPEGGVIQNMPTVATPVKVLTKEERMEDGKNVYTSVCQACHQADGKGIPNAFPPVANSDYLNADATRGVKAILHGLEGKVTVNGKIYNGVMPKQTLSDNQIANVITYVLNNFDNKGGEITAAQVNDLRKSK